ncbi:polysaccharide biosynthesis/export family protein [Synechococcus sp. BIOS-U3-1]|uniref:polysaccharide biosynthesis/export family protein n=1 Tax=Synechococcus sp. BIOS-U3-1 TaxID=1400865 RepID=UPI001645D783|nr:polysaccharide biosynthesis/export family protein [Synechococcus sp. BIOS-U3-1]QNI57155.1 polysaccharide biosynthesis/export family protein [Synechococcus sp. BIOS-U3-1]
MLNTRYLWAITAGALLTLQAVRVGAQQLIEIEEPTTRQQQPLPLKQRAQITYDAYILGPGDGLQIELLDLPELSGTFSIGPDGTLYLPRLRALYVEGLTVEELRYFLTEQFRAYVRDPQIYVRPVIYRPIRIYVSGEVKRPGYYTLSGNTERQNLSTTADIAQARRGTSTTTIRPGLGQVPGGLTTSAPSNGLSTSGALFPTVFDAIRSAEGITPYSNLSKVQVTRKRALNLGGGRIRANLNFLSLITGGDESQNIRLFDGDVVRVTKSNIVMKEQLLQAGQTNLSPQFMSVFVSGRVQSPGGVVVPQGSAMNQAIALAGGRKLLSGKVEFIRFTREGEIDRRIFNYNPNAPSDDYRNPVLMSGDLINLRESPLSATAEMLNEFAAPIVGIYSVYSIFNDF